MPAVPRPPLPGYRRSPLTVGCVQFDPKLKDVAGNASRIRELTRRIQPGRVDLLVLPEMSLSGYMFSSAQEVTPFLEDRRTGPTPTLCSELARKYSCWVIGGYPEKITRDESGSDSRIEQVDDQKVGYNSAVIVSPDGTVYGNYRKSFLFDTDKTWARQGNGFEVFDLPPPLGRTVVGICMDMNPKDFLSPFNAYEFGSFIQKERAELVVTLMNWLEPPGEPPADDQAVTSAAQNSEGPELSTLNYWAHRLTPLHDPAPDYASPETTGSSLMPDQVTFVACNRVGTERDTTFVGTSCVMNMTSNPSGIDLIEAMGKKEEGVMFALIN